MPRCIAEGPARPWPGLAAPDHRAWRPRQCRLGQAATGWPASQRSSSARTWNRMSPLLETSVPKPTAITRFISAASGTRLEESVEHDESERPKRIDRLRWQIASHITRHVRCPCFAFSSAQPTCRSAASGDLKTYSIPTCPPLVGCSGLLASGLIRHQASHRN